MTTSTAFLYNPKGYINPFCQTCRAYTEHHREPGDTHVQHCQTCKTTHPIVRSSKQCFCNTCLLVTPHVPYDAPRPECTICETPYSAKYPVDQAGHVLREAAELELKQLEFMHPVRYGTLAQRGGYVAALAGPPADGAPSDESTSPGI